jgi:hypothetical protein
MKKFIQNTIRFIIFTIVSIVSATITTMLFIIMQKNDFIENININYPNSFFLLFVAPTNFLIFCLLNRYYFKPILSQYRWYRPEANKEEIETMKTPETNEIEKQFFYDASNPCPYCDTKFEHTALHCAMYFNDIERLKELIDLIKKVDGVDDYKTFSNVESNIFYGTLYNQILNKTDLNYHNVLQLAISIGNVDIIKTVFKPIGLHMRKNGLFININLDDDESIKFFIYSYKYKKHQTGKDIKDKDKYQEQQDLIKNEHEKRLRGN